MEKKNIGMKVTIVILCLLVVGLTAYIMYDKVLDNNNNNKNNNNDDEITGDSNEINENDNIVSEEQTAKLEKLKNSFWWNENTDKFLTLDGERFDIFREGKGCGPDDGCGRGNVHSIVKVSDNIYDINFIWDAGTAEGDDDINYLATIDISNIDNDEITLIDFYTINEINKTKIIDDSEKYICSGKEYDDTLNKFGIDIKG